MNLKKNTKNRIQQSNQMHQIKGPKTAKMLDWVDRGKTPLIVFKIFELKTMQKAILNCLQISNVIANLPTGFGKSMLFQYQASLQNINQNCVLVIVPLKALLWDTIRQARELGITAQQIDNSIINQYYKNSKLAQMLVTTPQKIFATELTYNFLQSLHNNQQIKLLVIDQCHCISQWGYDFRPAYLRLAELKTMMSGVRLLAISATLTPETREDLVTRMFLQTSHYFQASYHRSNLYYCVLKCQKPSQFKQTILSYLLSNRLQQQSGIIYCQTILSSQKLYEQLSPVLKVGLFHSQLSENRRLDIYQQWIVGKINTIVGTICFGMGINKKDIRYVINVGISKSVENYYQESGRAGRDGKLSHCVIISYPNQLTSLQYLISKGNGNHHYKSHQLYKLQQIKQYADQQILCRRVVLFQKLGQNFCKDNCNLMCDICGQNSVNMVKIINISYYNQVKKIIQQLQRYKKKYTKKQLIAYLVGKNIKKMIDKVQNSQIFGIFQKLSKQVVQNIVNNMFYKNLIQYHTIKNRGGFFIPYIKPCNQASLRNFTQFTINIKQKNQKPIEKNKLKDKFNRFLANKGLSVPNKIPTPIMIKPTISQQQAITQGQSIKCDITQYQLFFSQLFGNEYTECPKQTNKKQVDEQFNEYQLIQEQLQRQQNGLNFINNNIEQQNNKSHILSQKEIDQLITQSLKKNKIGKLKRNSIEQKIQLF